jgi:hypothetical protein
MPQEEEKKLRLWLGNRLSFLLTRIKLVYTTRTQDTPFARIERVALATRLYRYSRYCTDGFHLGGA